MLPILSLLCTVGSIACLIIMVIPLFQEKGALHGILGIICGLYTFIWGWMNATRLGKKQIMMIWTAIIVVSIVLNVMVASSASSGIQTTP